MRNQIKKLRSVTGLVNAFRALPGDLRVARWVSGQAGQIARYCASHEERKLHVGCGHNLLDGWLNADVSPEYGCVLYLDATSPFPIADATFDYIYSEHVIQHFPFRLGQVMLSECCRILKPGGVLRLSTPNLMRLATLLTERQGAAQTEYTRLVSEKYIPENTERLPAFVVNNFFWDFTHQFVYDPESMQHAMKRAGFAAIEPVQIGVSADPNLADLEHHGRIVGDTINEFETMIFEARKT